MTSSAINKMFEIFGSIFEQNGNVGKFGTYFRTKFNLSPIFEKMQIFRTSFQGDLTNLKKYGQVKAYLKFNIRPHWPRKVASQGCKSRFSLLKLAFLVIHILLDSLPSLLTLLDRGFA